MVNEDVHYLVRSSIARRILECLGKSEKPLSPKQIAQQIDVARDNVSTRIIKLSERRFVECINPDARTWRFYKTTQKGSNALKAAKELV